MAYIIETPNAFKPLTDVRKSEHPGDVTIRQWLNTRYPGFTEFEVPTICVVNGKAKLRDEWMSYLIKPTDVVNFIAVPQGPIAFIVISILIAVASIAVTLLFGVPSQPDGTQPESDPVFSTKGQTNSIRLGEPIECAYGKNRLYPSFASRPYFQYVDNEQFQYALFCLGQGYYDVHEVRIGDSDINNYQEATYEITEPGGTVTLFPTNVFTSVEAGGQTLYAPNEPEFGADGWIGPFVASASGSDSTYIEVDVVFPKGLYYSNTDGGLSQQNVDFQIQAQEIDDSGTPIGLWFELTGGLEGVSGTTTTPQRRTIGAAVVTGRYHVRMRRSNNRDSGHRYGNEIKWEGLKSYINDAQQFGDVTLLAVKIRATSNLNERTQQRFNVIATRKLVTHQSNGFNLTPEPTRSIVWAMVDVFRNVYGANMMDDTLYDWDTLYDLEAEYESRGEYFDWVFRDPITVWEAARIIARAGRAVPLINGSLISMKRDGQLSTPVAMFTPDNIIEGTLTWDVKLWDIDEHDSIRAEYTDPNTDYKQETVMAILPGDFGTRPRDIRYSGIADRDHAYHEAMYQLAVDRYLRENVTFETGMEGYIPTFGDLIIVAHDVPSWSTAGYVVHIESESNGDFQLWLSEPVELESGQNNVIYLKDNDGSVLGPFDVSGTESDQQIRITSLSLTTADFLLGGENEPMLFVFGVSGRVSKFCRVVEIVPQGQERIRITAVTEDSTVHSFDGLSAPALEDNDNVPIFPELPEVTNLTLVQLNTSVLQVTAEWNAAFGAEYYIIQVSTDNVNWEQIGETERTSLTFQVRPGALYVRVAAVNFGQGPWATATASISSLAGLDVVQDFLVLTWTIEWLEVINAESYNVYVYDNTIPSAPVLKRTTNIDKTADRTYTYDLDAAVADGNENREMLVTVAPVFNDGEGTGASHEFSNPCPAAPGSPASEAASAIFDSAGDYLYNLSWTVPAEDDLITVKVWVSDIDGFDPDVVSPVFEERQSGVGHAGIPTSTQVTIPADSNGEHGPYKWRVAVFDIWGDEVTCEVNYTAQQDIDPTSGWVA